MDVNLTPDKRKVLLQEDKLVQAVVKVKLRVFREKVGSSYNLTSLIYSQASMLKLCNEVPTQLESIANLPTVPSRSLSIVERQLSSDDANLDTSTTSSSSQGSGLLSKLSSFAKQPLSSSFSFSSASGNTGFQTLKRTLSQNDVAATKTCKRKFNVWRRC